MAEKKYYTIRTSLSEVLDKAIKEGLSTQNPVLYAAAINGVGRSPEDPDLYSQGQFMITKDEKRINRMSRNYILPTNGEKELRPYLEDIRNPGEISTENPETFTKYLVEGIGDSLKYPNFIGVQIRSNVSKESSCSGSSTYRLKASFNELVGGFLFPVICSYTYEQSHDDHDDTPESIRTYFLKEREKKIRSNLQEKIETAIYGDALTITPKDQ